MYVNEDDRTKYNSADKAAFMELPKTVAVRCMTEMQVWQKMQQELRFL